MTDRRWARIPTQPGLAASMPSPQLLVIDEQPDGVFLYRYAADGVFGGDTWHMSTDDALQEASYEFGPGIAWQPIPDEEADPVAYAIKAAQLAD